MKKRIYAVWIEYTRREVEFEHQVLEGVFEREEDALELLEYILEERDPDGYTYIDEIEIED